MKTVGQLFREKRTERKLTLPEIEKSIKIRTKFLDAIERDAFLELPSQAYTKGFIKNYAMYLGFDTATILAFYRRQTMEQPKNALLPKSTENALKKSLFRLTPTRFLGLLGFALIMLFLGYFLVQYQRIQLPPNLRIVQPNTGLQTIDRRIDIIGETDTDATVIINGVGVLVRGDGKFFDQVTLELGSNKITVSSTSKFGKSITKYIEVKRVE